MTPHDTAEAESVAKGKSLLERAPNDLKINWQGSVQDRWTIRVEATITGQDEAEAVREIIRLLSLASEPAPASETPHDRP